MREADNSVKRRGGCSVENASLYQPNELWLAISWAVVDVKTWSMGHSDGKNMENAWNTEMA